MSGIGAAVRMAAASATAGRRTRRIGINALYWLPDQMGGTQTYLLRLVEALRKVAPQHEYVLFLNESAAERGAPELAGLETEVCPLSGNARSLRVAWEHTRLPVRARARGLELLHSTGYIAPRTPGIPGITTVHDLIHYRFPRQIAAGKRTVWRWIFPRSLARARHVITSSETVRRELVDRFPCTAKRVTAVPLGVDERWSAMAMNRGLDIHEEPPYLLAVASAAPHKNLGVLIRSLRLLDDSVRLKLVGMRTSSTDSLIRQARMAGVGSRVDFTGRIPDEELSRLYCGAAALVFPSLYEGFGLPILEAMASGCPVLAADRPVVRETAGEAALFFRPEDESSLAEAVMVLTTDMQLRQELVAAGRLWAAERSWTRTALMTASVYDQVLDKGP